MLFFWEVPNTYNNLEHTCNKQWILTQALSHSHLFYLLPINFPHQCPTHPHHVAGTEEILVSSAQSASWEQGSIIHTLPKTLAQAE